MRPKIYLPILGLVALGLGLVWLKYSLVPADSVAPGTTVIQTNIPEKVSAPPAAPAKEISPSETMVVVIPSAAAPAVTVEELQTLAMNDDAESLRKILAALTNSDPEIRTAARDAAVQFDDRTAAVTLRAVAANTTDPAEKQELLEGADFLELPSLDIRPGNEPTPANGSVSNSPAGTDQ